MEIMNGNDIHNLNALNATRQTVLLKMGKMVNFCYVYFIKFF